MGMFLQVHEKSEKNTGKGGAVTCRGQGKTRHTLQLHIPPTSVLPPNPDIQAGERNIEQLQLEQTLIIIESNDNPTLVLTRVPKKLV